jgi:hypothetical protein
MCLKPFPVVEVEAGCFPVAEVEAGCFRLAAVAKHDLDSLDRSIKSLSTTQ